MLKTIKRRQNHLFVLKKNENCYLFYFVKNKFMVCVKLKLIYVWTNVLLSVFITCFNAIVYFYSIILSLFHCINLIHCSYLSIYSLSLKVHKNHQNPRSVSLGSLVCIFLCAERCSLVGFATPTVSEQG